MKKRIKKIFLISISIFILFFALFSIISVFHAYSFTHPKPKGDKFSPENMNLTFKETVIVSLIGVNLERVSGKALPSDYFLKYESVSFNSRDGIIIKGWLIKAGKPKGTIILAHGWGGSKEGLLDYALFLNKNGYNSLLFDFRGFGESEGDYTSLGYYEKYDILGAVDYLKTRKDIDAHKIGGYGFSMGGAAMILAAEDSEEIKVIVLDSTFTTIHQNIAMRFKEVYGFPKFPFATSLTFFGGLINGFDGFDLAPIRHIDRIDIPLLFIQGSNDNQVLVEDAKMMYREANEPKDILIVHNAGHLGSHKTDPKGYEKKVISFFDEYLK